MGRSLRLVVRLTTLAVSLVAAAWLLGSAVTSASRPAERETGPRLPTRALAASPRPAGGALSSSVGFVENRGQWDPGALYRARVARSAGAHLDVWLTGSGFVYDAVARAAVGAGGGVPEARRHNVAVEFVGGEAREVSREAARPGVHTWLGARPAAGARAFDRVIYRRLYAGIDARFDARPGGGMETSFEVAPGADPGLIALRYAGASAMRIDDDGNLTVATTVGDIVEARPVAFQTDAAGARQPVDAAFALEGNLVRVALGSFDRARPLVIDPTVTFSRRIGGASTDYVSSLHEDATGRYVTGWTLSTDYPTTPGVVQPSNAGSFDMFAARFNRANDTLLWATYLGTGSSDYLGRSLLAADGSLYVAGHTLGASPALIQGSGGSYDLVIHHLASDGQSLLASARLGGNSADYLGDMAWGAGGDLVLVGQTASSWASWGSPPGYDTAPASTDAFALRVNPALTAMSAFTFFGGSSSAEGGLGVAVDAGDSVYLYGVTQSSDSPLDAVTGPGGGWDTFVAKLDSGLDNLTYARRFGGSTADGVISLNYFTPLTNSAGANPLTLDAAGRAWFVGTTLSTDFPTTPGAVQPGNAGNYDVMVAAVNAGGTGLAAATLLGGTSTDIGRAIRLSSQGVVVTGGAASGDFPTTEDRVQEGNAGNYDFFLSVLSGDLTELRFSTLWGGSSTDIASALVAAGTRVVVAGEAFSPNYPAVPEGSPVFGPGGSYDTGLVEIDLGAAPAVIPVLGPPGLAALGLLLAGIGIARAGRGIARRRG